MVCKYCGKEIREGLIYCPFCGCRVAAEKQAPAPEPEIGKKWRESGRDSIGKNAWKKAQSGSVIVQALIVGGLTFVISLWFSFYAVGFAFKSTLAVGSTVYAVLATVLLSQIGGMTPSTARGKRTLVILCGLGIGVCIFLAAMICGNNVGQQRDFDFVMVCIYTAAPAIAWLLWVISHWSGIRALWTGGRSGKLGVTGIILLSALVWSAGIASIAFLLTEIL